MFQHLSNAQIQAALANLAKRFERAITTKSVLPEVMPPNVDILSGYRTRDGFGSSVFVYRPLLDIDLV